MHDRQPVLDGDIEGADDFFHRQRIPGAALHARVVGVNDDLAAVDDADAADDAGARHLAAVFGIGGERREFEKRRAWIEQQLDAVVHEHFVLPRQAFEIARRAFAPRGLLARMKRLRQAVIMGAVEPELLRGDIDPAVDAAHGQAPACGASVTSGAPRWKACPTATCTAATSPSRHALIAVSSFMLSITRSVSPGATRWPSPT